VEIFIRIIKLRDRILMMRIMVVVVVIKVKVNHRMNGN